MKRRKIHLENFFLQEMNLSTQEIIVELSCAHDGVRHKKDREEVASLTRTPHKFSKCRPAGTNEDKDDKGED
jgi:hypothetical protein